MAESNFVDYVKIYCRSGKGGAGSAHLHRAKYTPKGGPDGGDGGRGGHIILRANRNYWTLLHLRYERHVYAGNGESGSDCRSTGKDGADRVIEVPCGTVAYDAVTGEYLCELTDDGQEIVLLKGGRGGLGNWHFRSATNQTPRYAQPGEPAIERTVVLELKLLADVGPIFPGSSRGQVKARDWVCVFCVISSVMRCSCLWSRPTQTISPAIMIFCWVNWRRIIPSCSTSIVSLPYRNAICSMMNC